VIDDDLGRSGGGIARPGFERLLAAICEGRVGAVLAIEASRLARNGRDWHTLIEFCGLVGTIIVDEDGIYDPRHPNDRLLLGMKGTMSELELSLFRQRSHEALKQKARRGALFLRPGAPSPRQHRRLDPRRVAGPRPDRGHDLRVCSCGCSGGDAGRGLFCQRQTLVGPPPRKRRQAPRNAGPAQNSVMGDTREIWFIHGGFLYEVTTYKQLDSWLAPHSSPHFLK
jgi:hypothetical protein